MRFNPNQGILQEKKISLKGTFSTCILLWLFFFTLFGLGESVWLLIRKQVTDPALVMHALLSYPLIGILGGIGSGVIIILYVYLFKKKATLPFLTLNNLSILIAWLFTVLTIYYINVWQLRRIPFYSFKSITADMVVIAIALIIYLCSYYFLTLIYKKHAESRNQASTPFRRLILVSVVLVLLAAFSSSSIFRCYNKMEDFHAVSDVKIKKTAITKAAKGRPNIIIILIDALRSDHLSPYGYQAESSPAINQLASQGVLFTKMTAQSSWTRPSVASIFTSLGPSLHGVYDDSHRLGNEKLTLAEKLKKNGYNCAAFLGNNREISKANNFDQGFDYFEEFKEKERLVQQLVIPHILIGVLNKFGVIKAGINIDTTVNAADMNNKFLPWLKDHANEPFFAYLHFMEPHGPYHSHSGKFFDIQPRPSPPNRDLLLMRYDREISYLDKHLGQIFKALRDLDIDGNTILIFIADHGEEFLDHGDWSHGKTLYQEVINVPFIIKIPGIGHRTISTPVQHIDIFPTILDLIENPIPATLMGKSLVPLFKEGKKFLSRPIYSELGPIGQTHMYALRQDDLKLIFSAKYLSKPVWEKELYDLARDPDETINIYNKNDARSMVMESRLHDWIEKKSVKTENRVTK